MPTSSVFKKRAMARLSGNWVSAIIVAVLSTALGGSVTGFMVLLRPDLTQYKDSFTEFLSNYFFTFLSAGTLIWGWILFILGSVISLGVTRFYLDLTSGREPQISVIFSYFKNFLRALTLRVFRLVFVGLASLLLVVPGVILGYSYALAPYLLAEKPYNSVLTVLGQSKRMMKGKRAAMFKMHMSFLGWILLGILTLGVGFVFVMPYISAANAEFYREVRRTTPLI